MTTKFRTYDCSTNIILSSKSNTYGPYKSVKQRNKSSNKKMEPLHIKIFDRQKKNQRILSRNDRMDLFLEGENFSETKQLSSKSHIDRSLYKILKGKKKQEILVAFRSQTRTNGWQTTNHSSQNQQTKIIKSDYGNFVHTSEESRKVSQNAKNLNGQNIVYHQKSVEHIKIKNLITRSPKVNSPKKHSFQDNFSGMAGYKQEQIKSNQKLIEKSNTNKVITSSQNQLQKLNKVTRPLFYLQTKEISHIRAESFIVTEFPSGQIIFGNFFKKTGQIASLTKIMTFYTVFQIAEKYSKNVSQQIVEIDEQAQSITGTSAQVFVGDTYTVQQLFYGLMLPSGNDAAIALAKWGGSLLEMNDPMYKTEVKNTETKTFIKHMNLMAKKCGMKSSKFCNPHGLPHSQSCSNAQDIASLVYQCLKIQLFRTVIKTKRYSCWVDHKGVKHEVIWDNTNKLLRRPNFIGGKTGVTVTAGPCLVSCYEIGQKILTVVVLRTNKLSRRFKQTRYILGLAMTKLDRNYYKQKIRQVLKNDAELDSDNSDDEQQFNYERNDAKEMAKRNKILTFEM